MVQKPEMPKNQYLHADITAEGMRSGLTGKLLSQFRRIRKGMDITLDDCSLEVRRNIYGTAPDHPQTMIFLRKNPPIDEAQTGRRADGGRPAISAHEIDMELGTSTFKGDVEALTWEEMTIVHEALQRLLEVPDGQL